MTSGIDCKYESASNICMIACRHCIFEWSRIRKTADELLTIARRLDDQLPDEAIPFRACFISRRSYQPAGQQCFKWTRVEDNLTIFMTG